MPQNHIHVGRATDPKRYVATDDTVWFGEISAAPTEEQLVGLSAEHRFAAHLDGDDAGPYAGVYGVFPLTLSAPGPRGGVRQLPAAGLTWVGVHPDHRRKGVLTAMMRHHLEQVREEQGTHLSVLHASEPAIYGRYGYGLASLELEVSLGRGTRLVSPELEDAAAALGTSLATASDPGMPARLWTCHLQAADLGSVVGALGYYDRICRQLPEHLRDKEPWRVLFARRDGRDVGFAMFRRTHKWERARPSGALEVRLLVGDPASRLALLRRLVDYDLIGSVKVGGVGTDDPLLAWVGGPRAASDVAIYDSLWVRLVDVPDALQERSWGPACDVVVQVADAFAPWNAGAWRIHSDAAGAATVEPTAAAADLSLGVEALGAAYLGGSNLVAMNRAGLIVEHRGGAVAELWRAMRTDVAPAAAIEF